MRSTAASTGNGTCLLESIREVLTLEVLHHDERDALGHADVRHIDRVRVPHAPRGLGLAEEALRRALARREVRQEHLDGDALVHAAVPALVDRAHPAAPEHAPELVIAEERARRQ
jgi:hypothetical protein